MQQHQLPRLGIVGAGVMAEALIAGVIERGLAKSSDIIASHPRGERREELADKYHVEVTASNEEAVRRSEIVVLTIKPQLMHRVMAEIRPALQSDKLVISIIAGARLETLATELAHAALVRVMPNTPAQIGAGMSIWYATPETTSQQRANVRALLGGLGSEREVDDERFVAMATAVSGTGPTYVFLVMEALIDAAVHLGFPRHVAHDLVIETLEGSTLFAKQSGMHPAELRNMVTSPGGTSAAALHELESGRLRTVLSEAVWAAYRRTVELGDQLEAGAGAPSQRRPVPAGMRPEAE
jgi:pyrroline-5-carboxylate reductase